MSSPMYFKSLPLGIDGEIDVLVLNDGVNNYMELRQDGNKIKLPLTGHSTAYLAEVLTSIYYNYSSVQIVVAKKTPAPLRQNIPTQTDTPIINQPIPQSNQHQNQYQQQLQQAQIPQNSPFTTGDKIQATKSTTAYSNNYTNNYNTPDSQFAPSIDLKELKDIMADIKHRRPAGMVKFNGDDDDYIGFLDLIYSGKNVYPRGTINDFNDHNILINFRKLKRVLLKLVDDGRIGSLRKISQRTNSPYYIYIIPNNLAKQKKKENKSKNESTQSESPTSDSTLNSDNPDQIEVVETTLPGDIKNNLKSDKVRMNVKNVQNDLNDSKTDSTLNDNDMVESDNSELDRGKLQTDKKPFQFVIPQPVPISDESIVEVFDVNQKLIVENNSSPVISSNKKTEVVKEDHIITNPQVAYPKLNQVIRSFGTDVFQEDEFLEKVVSSKIDITIATSFLYRQNRDGILLNPTPDTYKMA